MNTRQASYLEHAMGEPSKGWTPEEHQANLRRAFAELGFPSTGTFAALGSTRWNTSTTMAKCLFTHCILID